MSHVKILETLHKQVSTDRRVRRYLGDAGFHIGEDASRSLEGKLYLVHFYPLFEREDFDESGVFDEPNHGVGNEGEVDEDQTSMIAHVLLVKIRLNSNDARNRIVGDGKIAGILEACRLVKSAMAKRWDLGLNIEKHKIENTQYFLRPRFAEAQITVVYWETVFETSRAAAYSKDGESLGIEDEPDLTVED